MMEKIVMYKNKLVLGLPCGLPVAEKNGGGLACGALAALSWTLRHSVMLGLNYDTPVKKNINFSYNKGLME